MFLSCSCGEWEGEGIGWEHSGDFSKLETKRRRKCRSCGEVIEVGTSCLKFQRFRSPRDEVELRIHDEDGLVYLADHFMCQDCGGIFLSLEALGYCLHIAEPVQSYQREYWALTGFNPVAAKSWFAREEAA